MDATLGILLDMKENVTTQTKRVNTELGGMSDTMAANRMAVRELAMGVNYLGMTFLSMGVAMQSSNNAALKGFSSTMILVGGFLSAVGSAFQFISAISKIIDALKKLTAAEILAKAFSGPAGWATLIAGGAIAAGTVYGLSKMTGSTAAPAKTEKPTTTINLTQNIAGSVVTERELTTNTQRGLLLKEQRSNSTGIK